MKICVPVNKQIKQHTHKTANKKNTIITVKYKFQDFHLVIGNPHL